MGLSITELEKPVENYPGPLQIAGSQPALLC